MKIHKMSCPNCNGTLDIKVNGNRDYIFCPYCGQKFFIDNGKKEYTLNRNVTIKKDININRNINYTERTINDAEIIKAKADVRDTRNVWIMLAVAMMILLAIPVTIDLRMKLAKYRAEQEGMVTVGYHRDFEGQNYEAVLKQMEIIGFETIETIDLNDAGIAFWKVDTVETISIDGNSSFSSGDYFYINDKVMITYH